MVDGSGFVRLQAYMNYINRVKLDEAAMPQPAEGTPNIETVGGAIGEKRKCYALEDHRHPRRSSTTYTTLGADGTATVKFTQTFDAKPGLMLSETDASANNGPLVLRGVSWQMAEGKYSGVVIQGQRARNLPQISGVTGLLAGVITGVNTLVGALTNYNVFGGSAAGATVSVIAVARSDVG